MRRLIARACSTCLLAAAATGACVAPADEVGTAEEDLTSITARTRQLTFDGRIFADATASDADILSLVREQTQTAIGALRTQEIALSSREARTVDPRTFKKKRLSVVDTKGQGPPREVLEVRYRYTDRAVVPIAMARRSTLAAALLSPGYAEQSSRILRECTPNDAHTRELGELWYVFEPARASCQRAIKAESDAIATEQAKLEHKSKEVSLADVRRLYLPITVQLGADKTERGTTYPDYHRLFSGGVDKNALVISVLYGFIDDKPAKHPNGDLGYTEYLHALREIFAAKQGWRLTKTKPSVDLSKFHINEKTVDNLSVFDFIRMELDDTGYPPGLNAKERTDLKRQFAARITKTHLTFELPAKVQVGNARERDFTIRLVSYFGTEEDPEPFRLATRTSDVVVYNGHSFLGSGPLDPEHFTRRDFPESYQLMFFDSCVSFNYYHRDFFPLKQGESKNLDLITNGLETPADASGVTQGRFIASLIGGQEPSYRTLLQKMSDTDGLRVVDGELDNTYSPERTPVRLRTGN